MRLAYLLRIIWAVSGMVVAVLLTFASATDGLIFALAYRSPAGSYTGQAADRHTAWLLLFLLLGLWAFVLIAMVWPAVRWRRRGMYTPPGTPRQPDAV